MSCMYVNIIIRLAPTYKSCITAKYIKNRGPEIIVQFKKELINHGELLFYHVHEESQTSGS